MPSPSNDSDSPDSTPDKKDEANKDEANKDETGKDDEGKDDKSKKPEPDSLHGIRDDLDHAPGGLRPVDPADQQALEDAVPRNEDGTPERYPDPFKGWSQLQNDGGNEVPGRGNNCADCSRSFLETWYGNPQVSAPRTLDPDSNGKIDLLSPEDNANDNQIRWSGAPHTYAGPANDPDTPRRIEYDLLQAGPGSASIVQVSWPGGGGHAFNAVNHDGKIVWVDTQTGEVSHDPIHIENATHAWHIPLDPDGNPLHPATPQAENNNNQSNADQSNDQQNNSNTQTSQNANPDQAQQPDQSQQSAPDTAPDTSPESTNNDPAGDKPDNDAASPPTDPDGTSTPDQSPSQPSPDRDTTQESTPDSKPDAKPDSTPDSKPDSKPDSDPDASPSVPHQQTDTDPRTDDPSPTDPRTPDPRTPDPRTPDADRTDPRADDPRTADPRRDDDTRPDDKGPAKDDHTQDPNRPDDRPSTPDDPQSATRPDALPDSAPDQSPSDPSDTTDTKPAQLNTDSNVPTRESLPPGKNAEATRHIEDATQNKKPLYGDIAPANNTQPSADRSADPNRPDGPAEPAGSSEDAERAKRREADKKKLDWANSDKEEHKKWFKDYYKEKNGHRKSTTRPCDDGYPAPQLHPADPPNRWMLASDAPDPDPESYTDWKPNQSDRTDLSDNERKRLNDAAKRRQEAIDADRQPHKDRKAAKDAYAQNKTPENEQKFKDADEAHSPLHGEMTRASEDYGDQVAEFHAMPDNFRDAERIDNRATGNNRFDQIWRNPGPPAELVVVEAKGSTDAGLGERRGLASPDQDSSGPDATTAGDSQQQPDGTDDGDDSTTQDEPRSSVPRVKQGTRAYFETILHEMDTRAAKTIRTADTPEQRQAGLDEQQLADELRDALNGKEGAPNLRYMLVKGDADGTQHGGYEMSEFDIRTTEEKQRANNSAP